MKPLFDATRDGGVKWSDELRRLERERMPLRQALVITIATSIVVTLMFLGGLYLLIRFIKWAWQ